MDAVTQWLARARGHDLVAVAAQEASYPHSRANLKPEAVWAETLAAQRGGGLAEAEAARDAARLAAAEGGSTASSSDSEEPHDAAGRTASSEDPSEDLSDAPRHADIESFAKKKKRGFFGSSYFARASGALAGALAGGVAAGPLAPFGLVAGAAAGYYSSAKLASELKSRRHWFRVVAAAMGPEYVPVQTATLLQMRLIVFAKRVTVMDKNLIQNTRVGYQATGLLNAVGNKGGLMVRLALADGGSVAFVACHLAAHEGEKHVAARDESVAAILRGCWESSVVRAVGETDVGPTADADDAPTVARRKRRVESVVQSSKNARQRLGAGVVRRPRVAGVHVARVRVRRPELPRRPRDGRVVARVGFTNAKNRLGWPMEEIKRRAERVPGRRRRGARREDGKEEKRRRRVSRVRRARGSEHPRDADGGGDLGERRGDRLLVDAVGQGVALGGGSGGAGPMGRARRRRPASSGNLARTRAARFFSRRRFSFAPTFKLETFDGDAPPANAVIVTDALEKRNTPQNTREHAKKRIPSWCDRVLARSLSPAHACRFRAYASCPGVRTSDHAPVHLSCELDFPSERECRNSEFSSERRDEKEGDVESLARVTLALTIRVSSFRVALEDDEESHLDDFSKSSPRDADDDANVVVQSSEKRKETVMEALVARAARLRTTHSADDRGTDRGTVPGEHSAVTKTSHHGLSDASAGARAAMEKLTRGAVATARFFLQTTRRGCDFSTDGCRDAASEGDETHASGASVGAGVTCRPVQPHIERDEQTDAAARGGKSDKSDKSLRVSVPAVAHWAASSLTAFERAGLCDDASLERSVRALGARVVAASVAVDKEHAGIAVIPLGDVCDALRGEKLETLRAALAALARGAAGHAPLALASVARPFDVPFDRFARRRGRAEGTLTLEIVVVRGRDGT